MSLLITDSTSQKRRKSLYMMNGIAIIEETTNKEQYFKKLNIKRTEEPTNHALEPEDEARFYRRTCIIFKMQITNIAKEENEDDRERL